MIKDGLNLKPGAVGERLKAFYSAVDAAGANGGSDDIAGTYYKSALQASNDKSSRIRRGDIIRNVLRDTI